MGPDGAGVGPKGAWVLDRWVRAYFVRLFFVKGGGGGGGGR